MKKLLLSLLIFFSPWMAYAHDGHGIFEGHTLQHFLASPYHVGPVVLVSALLMIIVGKKIIKTRKA